MSSPSIIWNTWICNPSLNHGNMIPHVVLFKVCFVFLFPGYQNRGPLMGFCMLSFSSQESLMHSASPIVCFSTPPAVLQVKPINISPSFVGGTTTSNGSSLPILSFQGSMIFPALETTLLTVLILWHSYHRCLYHFRLPVVPVGGVTFHILQ